MIFKGLLRKNTIKYMKSKIEKLIDKGVIEGYSIEKDSIIIIIRENNISKIQELLKRHQNIKVIQIKDNIALANIGEKNGSV